MAQPLFNSPQKKWLREFFWLPAIEQFRASRTQELKYLTFAGPKGFDIDFFTERGVFKIENVRVWEKSSVAARALQERYGIQFGVKIGEAFDLSTAKDERQYFPHAVINLDFTNGAFQVPRPRYMPPKFELFNNIILAQREHTESFLLLVAFGAAPDMDGEQGRAFVQKMAFDLATRFGYTEPLFNLTRAPDRTYGQTLSAIIPCALIRLGGRYFYDTECLGKCLYFPYNRKQSAMLCFIFRLTYDHPALSEPDLQISNRMDEIVVRRQQESLGVVLLNVNKTIGRRRSTRPAR